MCLLMLQPWSVYRTVCSVQAKVPLPWQRPPDAGSALSSYINMEYLYNTVRAKHPGTMARVIHTACPFPVTGKLPFAGKWMGGGENLGQHLNCSSENTVGHRALLFR